MCSDEKRKFNDTPEAVIIQNLNSQTDNNESEMPFLFMQKSLFAFGILRTYHVVYSCHPLTVTDGNKKIQQHYIEIKEVNHSFKQMMYEY